MRILYLSLSSFNSYTDINVHSDLLRRAIDAGNEVFSILPNLTDNKKYKLYGSYGNKILKLRTGNIKKTSNFISKGLALLLLGHRYKKAIKKFCKEKFDLILYVTPPITIYKAIKFAKKKMKAKTYLLLKDIFPQNALDLGLLSNRGVKGIITHYFRNVEKKYYSISDRIGCMSRRNVEYLLENNPYIDSDKVCVVPNAVDLNAIPKKSNRDEVLEKYNFPKDKTVFIYGGNLGKPQCIPFIIECLRVNKNNEKAFFVICGNGSEVGLIKKYIEDKHPENLVLIEGLRKEMYDELVSACDVGMLFLDYRFTIPNYPSRVLSYMQFGMPVLACVDKSTDIGDDIVNGGFGWKCYSNNVQSFSETVDLICNMSKEELSQKGKNAYNYLCDNFSVDVYVNEIVEFANISETPVCSEK